MNISIISVSLSLFITSWFHLIVSNKQDDKEVLIRVKPLVGETDHIFYLEGLGIFVAVMRVNGLQSSFQNLMRTLMMLDIPLTLKVDLTDQKQLTNAFIICYSTSLDVIQRFFSLRERLHDHFLSVQALESKDFDVVRHMFEGHWMRTSLAGFIWDAENNRFRVNIDLGFGEWDFWKVRDAIASFLNHFEHHISLHIQLGHHISEDVVITDISLFCDLYPTKPSLALFTYWTLVRELNPIISSIRHLSNILRLVIYRTETNKATMQPDVRSSLLKKVEELLVFKEHHSDERTQRVHPSFTSDMVESSTTTDGGDEKWLVIESTAATEGVAENQDHSGFFASTDVLADKTSLSGRKNMQELFMDKSNKHPDAFLPLVKDKVFFSSEQSHSSVRSLEYPSGKRLDQKMTKLEIKATMQDWELNHDDYCALKNSLLPETLSGWLCQQHLYASFEELQVNVQLKERVAQIFLDKNQSFSHIWRELAILLKIDDENGEFDRREKFIIIHHFLIVFLEIIRYSCLKRQDLDSFQQIKENVMKFIETIVNGEKS